MTRSVVIFGGSGLVGQGVLEQSLAHAKVQRVVSVGRRTLDREHPKLVQVRHDDFLDFAALHDVLATSDACFWCLGMASRGVDEETYVRVTHDFTLAAAAAVKRANPRCWFCFVSGAGADPSQRSPMMWARVKGQTEHDLQDLGLQHLCVFRPGGIKATAGVVPRSGLTSAFYSLAYPLMRSLGAGTSNEAIGRAMLAVASGVESPRILSSRDINRLAALDENAQVAGR